MDDNIIRMFDINILEHDGFVDLFDDGTQYRIKKWYLTDLGDFTDNYAVIGFDGELRVYTIEGDLLFNGSLLDSKVFSEQLKEKINEKV